ncbi:tetratricopeptide repeat protein [candidate division WOR-3 bacterium]|uniref:Tetratricopeptide repeat protein n=1 Tax=candidate division WOR-3 bacterium TaxID=2052148 RepID=A0A938BSG3_UNCW3|nr:tetratricopeptide repeat protein [candidate division WOR-3 bacterium]
MAETPGLDLPASVTRNAPSTGAATGAAAFVARLLNTKERSPESRPERPECVRRDLGRMAEYLDGLPLSPPVVRQPFELGLAAMRACRWDEAVAYFKQAMSVTSGVHLVALLNQIGVCRYTQGRVEDALRCFHQSARLADELHTKRGRVQALNNIGLIHRDRGELDGALEYLEESLTLARELDDQWAVAILLGNTGNVWHDRGELEKALEYHIEALKISREIKDQWGVVSELADIGSIYMDKGRPDLALKYDEQALANARSVGYPLGVVTCLANIADIHRRRGRPDDALKCEEEALAVARKAGYGLGVASELGNIGLDLLARGKHEEAVPKLAEALSILLSIRVADGPRQALTGLDRCADRLGRQRVEALLKQSGFDDDSASDLLSRVDQTRMKRPAKTADRQLLPPVAG